MSKYPEERATVFPVSYLKQRFVYDPDKGTLHWRERPREHFKTDGSFKAAGRARRAASEKYHGAFARQSLETMR